MAKSPAIGKCFRLCNDSPVVEKKNIIINIEFKAHCVQYIHAYLYVGFCLVGNPLVCYTFSMLLILCSASCRIRRYSLDRRVGRVDISFVVKFVHIWSIWICTYIDGLWVNNFSYADNMVPLGRKLALRGNLVTRRFSALLERSVNSIVQDLLPVLLLEQPLSKSCPTRIQYNKRLLTKITVDRPKQWTLAAVSPSCIRFFFFIRRLNLKQKYINIVFFRYYFDVQMRDCMTFEYSDCLPSYNKFITLPECHNYCRCK